MPFAQFEMRRVRDCRNNDQSEAIAKQGTTLPPNLVAISPDTEMRIKTKA
jgi:hypothetical protein